MPSRHQVQLQQLDLGRDVGSVGLHARRSPMLRAQLLDYFNLLAA
jgi:hypothetical protein